MNQSLKASTDSRATYTPGDRLSLGKTLVLTLDVGWDELRYAAPVMGPFVGRGAELGTLRSELARATAGEPRVVLIEGEAGIGKSSLLTRFCGEVGGANVLRAAGEESERLLAYGVAGQLLRVESPHGMLDPMAVGTAMLSLIDRAQGRDGVVVVVVDDLHWADQRSAAALLFGLRRLQADRVIALISARPGELGAVGAGWERFVAGDPRATRVRLRGLEGDDVRALADSLGVGPLSAPAAIRLVDHTGGNPLYCRALLEEIEPGALRRVDGVLPAPKAFGSLVLSRVSRLSGPAQRLVTVAAVLGERSALRTVGELAECEDPVAALEEAVAADLMGEDGAGAGAEVSFVHPLTRAAIYSDLGPARRRRLHSQAAGLLPAAGALTHRVAAAAGADDVLARDLELAANAARGQAQSTRAGSWLEQAASLCSSEAERVRLLLDALDVLVSAADVGGALGLVGRMGDLPESQRLGVLLAELDLFAGRVVGLEERLSRIWEAHDPVRERAAGVRAAATLAIYLYVDARVSESAVWATRALDAGSEDPYVKAICRPLIVLCDVLLRGRRGGLAMPQLPADPAATALESTDALMLRGQARVTCDDLLRAVEDLRVVVARVSAGVPMRHPSQGLGMLTAAEFRLGSWDDASVHGELAVSLSHDADRVWDYAFVHGHAALVPACRGDWDAAAAHVDAAGVAAEMFGAANAVAVAATARATLAAARGDHRAVLDAAAALRRTGRADVLARIAVWDWPQLEIDALITLDRREEAGPALEQLEAAAEQRDHTAGRVSAAGLRGRLAVADGDHRAADAAFNDAWMHADGLPIPYLVAWLGLTDGRRLRQASRRREAIARLQAARELLLVLRARPYLKRCDDELRACGAAPAGEHVDPAAGLTPAELAVARLVTTGASNREVAAELFVSVKTVEFHLRHVYAKLGIRSRVALADRLGGEKRPN